MRHSSRKNIFASGVNTHSQLAALAIANSHRAYQGFLHPLECRCLLLVSMPYAGVDGPLVKCSVRKWCDERLSGLLRGLLPAGDVHKALVCLQRGRLFL